MSLFDQLIRHEGLRERPYRDTVGKLTIGVGRNLDDVGIAREEALILLANDVLRADAALRRALPWVETLDQPRQNVLINMTFNMGIKRLLGFKDTLKAVEEGRWDDAARGMLASKWASQVGARATELAEQMRTGIEK